MKSSFISIDHPAIACHDVAKLADWYCRHLGMRVIADNRQSPPTMLVGYDENATGGAVIELMPAKDAGVEPATQARWAPGLRHLALRVTNFDEAHAALKSVGVSFLSDPVAAIGGGRIVSFRDPEGNELQIVERNG